MVKIHEICNRNTLENYTCTYICKFVIFVTTNRKWLIVKHVLKA